MKLTIPKPTEIEAAFVKVVAPVRYDEEDIPNNFPFRKGDVWAVTINLDTGIICDWVTVAGVAADIHMKVTDMGCYYLLDRDKNQIAERESEYVPGFFPGDHYGDYIIFSIDASGKIANWDRKLDEETVRGAFFPDCRD